MDGVFEAFVVLFGEWRSTSVKRVRESRTMTNK